MRAVHYGFRGSQGSFCRYDSCVITDQLATGTGALERELLPHSGADRGALPQPGGQAAGSSPADRLYVAGSVAETPLLPSGSGSRRTQ